MDFPWIFHGFPLNWKLPPRPWLRGLRIAVRLGHPLWHLGGESHRPSQFFGTLDGTDGGFKDTLVARSNCDYIYTINIFIYTHNIIYIYTLYFDISIYIWCTYQNCTLHEWCGIMMNYLLTLLLYAYVIIDRPWISQLTLLSDTVVIIDSPWASKVCE